MNKFKYELVTGLLLMTMSGFVIGCTSGGTPLSIPSTSSSTSAGQQDIPPPPPNTSSSTTTTSSVTTTTVSAQNPLVPPTLSSVITSSCSQAVIMGSNFPTAPNLQVRILDGNWKDLMLNAPGVTISSGSITIPIAPALQSSYNSVGLIFVVNNTAISHGWTYPNSVSICTGTPATVPPPSGIPTIAFTENGVTSLNVPVKTPITFAWSSANAVSVSSTISIYQNGSSVSSDGCGNSSGAFAFDTLVDTMNPSPVIACQVGYTYVIDLCAQGVSGPPVCVADSLTVQ